MPFPLRFQRRHIHDDPAARVGRLAKADRQHGARNAKKLDRARQRKRVWRNHADVTLHVNEAGFVKALGIDDRRIDVRENLEFIRATHIVAITRGSVADDFSFLVFPHLAGLERFDHAVRFGHAANPAIRLDTHLASSTTILPNLALWSTRSAACAAPIFQAASR